MRFRIEVWESSPDKQQTDIKPFWVSCKVDALVSALAQRIEHRGSIAYPDKPAVLIEHLEVRGALVLPDDVVGDILRDDDDVKAFRAPSSAAQVAPTETQDSPEAARSAESRPSMQKSKVSTGSPELYEHERKRRKLDSGHVVPSLEVASLDGTTSTQSTTSNAKKAAEPEIRSANSPSVLSRASPQLSRSLRNQAVAPTESPELPSPKAKFPEPSVNRKRKRKVKLDSEAGSKPRLSDQSYAARMLLNFDSIIVPPGFKHRRTDNGAKRNSTTPIETDSSKRTPASRTGSAPSSDKPEEPVEIASETGTKSNIARNSRPAPISSSNGELRASTPNPQPKDRNGSRSTKQATGASTSSSDRAIDSDDDVTLPAPKAFAPPKISPERTWMKPAKSTSASASAGSKLSAAPIPNSTSAAESSVSRKQSSSSSVKKASTASNSSSEDQSSPVVSTATSSRLKSGAELNIGVSDRSRSSSRSSNVSHDGIALSTLKAPNDVDENLPKFANEDSSVSDSSSNSHRASVDNGVDSVSEQVQENIPESENGVLDDSDPSSKISTSSEDEAVIPHPKEAKDERAISRNNNALFNDEASQQLLREHSKAPLNAIPIISSQKTARSSLKSSHQLTSKPGKSKLLREPGYSLSELLANETRPQKGRPGWMSPPHKSSKQTPHVTEGFFTGYGDNDGSGSETPDDGSSDSDSDEIPVAKAAFSKPTGGSKAGLGRVKAVAVKTGRGKAPGKKLATGFEFE